MSSNIYILTDGVNTKIGITSDMNKRMQTYRTHNPNIRLVKQYPCSAVESKRVETAIKAIFKDSLSHTSKEWFSVSPDEVDKYVSTLIVKPLKSDVMPSHHGVMLTESAWEIKQEILKLLDNRHPAYDVIRNKKAELAELFANKFALGIPEDRLPENVIHKDRLNADLGHIPKITQRVLDATTSNHLNLPKDDHVWDFFHLVKLSSGYFIAVSTARVSMPYAKAISDNAKKNEISNAAEELGLHCTFHSDWSWHFPDKTDLILYQRKTQVDTLLKLWDTSFRKWVIERKEILINERFSDRALLKKTISDTTWDNTFPLTVSSYDELLETYLVPFVSVYDSEDEPFWMRDAYIYLFDRWKSDVKG